MAGKVPESHQRTDMIGRKRKNARKRLLCLIAAANVAQPMRFAHALFHRVPDVRLAALSGKTPAGAEALPFHLLADPVAVCREAAG